MSQPALILVMGVDSEHQIERIVNERWRIVRAKNSETARNLFQEGAVFVVIAALGSNHDDNLTEMQGLRSLAPDARFFITEHALELDGIIQAINDFQIDLFLDAPLDAEELLPQLESAFEQFELNQLNFQRFRLGVSERNRRVLCVDDDEEILALYQDLLSPTVQDQQPPRDNHSGPQTPLDSTRPFRASEGQHSLLPLKVTVARTGMEAVKLVNEALADGQPFSAGFFDIRLPGELEGLAAIRQIRAADPSIMCSIVSGYGDFSLDQIQEVFGEDVSWMYFDKPFSGSELQQAAINLVNTWNQRRKTETLTKFSAKLKYLLKKHRYSSGEGNVDALLETIFVKTLFDVLGADGGTWMFKDRHSQRLKVSTQHGLGQHANDLTAAISAWAVHFARPMILDTSTPNEDILTRLTKHQLQSVLSVPLAGEDGLAGVISAVLKEGSRKFHSEDLEIMTQLAEHMEIAIQDAWRAQDLKWEHELMHGSSAITFDP